MLRCGSGRRYVELGTGNWEPGTEALYREDGDSSTRCRSLGMTRLLAVARRPSPVPGSRQSPAASRPAFRHLPARRTAAELFPVPLSPTTFSMPIPPEISATFPSDTRDRGQQYYRRGVVRITSVDERGIGATVRGARDLPGPAGSERERASSCTSALARPGGPTASASTSGRHCSPPTRSDSSASMGCRGLAHAGPVRSSRPSSRGSASSAASATGFRRSIRTTRGLEVPVGPADRLRRRPPRHATLPARARRRPRDAATRT